MKQFANVYSFVPEKVSKSAAIRIDVPDGVSDDEARGAIAFNPAIKGSWVEETEPGVLIYKPDEPLRPGVYYAVNMDAPSAQMSGDFYVDEDPAIQAIFPAGESHEDTEITIMFNRPMVPLTTLATQEEMPLPVTIDPPTPGKFKWISTRNLQFIPESTLLPSSDYTVTVGEGLTSVDGLPVMGKTHAFTTRPLRYEYVSSGDLSFKAPITVAFNQPVDLAQTRNMIEVQANGGGRTDIIVEYGERTYTDRETGKQVTEEDPSKLFIYQKRDRHGRERLWDFETSYSLQVRGAIPYAGTRPLTDPRSEQLFVPRIITDISATSERSENVEQKFFDPQGVLVISFAEDIDKDKTRIEGKNLRDIKYGERCRLDEHGEPVGYYPSCPKEEDPRKLLLTFHDNFGKGERFELRFENIVTKDGIRANREPIVETIETFPQFAIVQMIPGSGEQNAPVDHIYVCSNSPLKDPGEEGMDSYIHANDYIVFGRWEGSHRTSDWGNSPCKSISSFETHIRYGLIPETNYTLNFSFTDEFGESAGTNLSLRTEAPSSQYTRFHNLQKAYNVTLPGRTKFTYAVENLEFVDMQICKLEPEAFLFRIAGRDSNTTPTETANCVGAVSERIELPKRYWVNNYFQIDLATYFADTRGNYIVTFSSPLYRNNDDEPLYDRTFVSVTNLSVGKKEVGSGETWTQSENPMRTKTLDTALRGANNLYWVNDMTTLGPAVGATVTQYTGQNSRPTARGRTGTTDVMGIAHVPVEREVAGAIVRYGAETAVVSDWMDMLQYEGNAQDASRTYLYTDRPIYRPGHEVFIRGIDRVGFDGSYEIVGQKQLPVTITDSRGQEVYRTNLEIGSYGTFSTSFKLPLDAALGTYYIQAFGHYAYFDVEEYVPAAFKLESKTDKEEYVNGDTWKLDVMADYYFGMPVRDGKVTYSVTSQDYYFDRYTDEYFNFDSGWYYCYYCGYGDQYLFRGEATLSDNGVAHIERKFDFKEYFENVADEKSKLVTVSVTVQDGSGKSVSLQRSFIVHKADFYIGAKTSKYYTGVGEPLSIRAKTVDITGKPISLSGITERVFKVRWETFKRQEVDGGFYYRSEKRRDLVSESKFSTDRNGAYEGPLTFTEEGQYEVELERSDDRGNVVKTVANVYIYGKNAITMPPNNNYELEMEVERTDLNEGDWASVLIKSPYDRAKVLITAERGTIYDHWIAEVKGGLYLHTFPIKKEYAPNIFISAMLLSPVPEVKQGQIRLDIGSREHELQVDVRANKTHYLPGEEVELSIETTDSTGRAVSAELSLAVADLSVLALKGNPKKDPLTFFYDGFPLAVTTASNVKNILYEVDIPLGSKGGGGGDPDDLATKKRGDFRDTAYWSATVVTDGNGKASVKFKLPDNLTTWQIESLGVTKDTKLGVDYDEITSQKDLMAVPLKPRFIVPGDEFLLGAQVFNRTDSGKKVIVSLESESLNFTENKEDSVTVAPGESRIVYFPVTAPVGKRSGTHSFTFTAKSEDLLDIVEQTIAITPNMTYETVATANMTKDDAATEYLYIPNEVIGGEGGLTINANATMAVFMTDALSYMATYPYGCSEQLASSLSTIAILTSALKIPNVSGSFETITYEGTTYGVADVVAKGLQKIYETQTPEGGFSYYKGLRPSYDLTLHVGQALAELRDAGFPVRADVIDRAQGYISAEALAGILQQSQSAPIGSSMFQNSSWAVLDHTRAREQLIFAAYVLRVMGDKVGAGKLDPYISEVLKDSAFINERIGSASLAYLAIITAQGFGPLESKRPYDALLSRIDIDGRGAYLTSKKETWGWFYETPVKDTALLLKAFVAHKDENESMGNVLRWLVRSRDSRGVWGSTHNTFTVVDAMTEYLKWQKETESHFTLKGFLDGVELFVHEFKPDNILETFTKFIPIDEFKRETLLKLTFNREDQSPQKNNFYYDMALRYFLPVESLPPRDEGITITRELYALSDTDEQTPLTKATVGEVVRGKIVVTVPASYTDVAIEDMIPAGFEIVNFSLATEDQSLLDGEEHGEGEYYGMAPARERSDLLTRTWEGLANAWSGTQAAQLWGGMSFGTGGSRKDQTRTLYPTYRESHDDRVYLYVETLAPGVYESEYYLRALVPGTFKYLPARAEEMYFPEVFGRTSGSIFTIEPQG